MQNYIVGVTPRLQKNEKNELVQVNSLYLNVLTQRGLNPIILPLDAPSIDKLINLCDAFLVIGGDDIDPINYGEENNGLSKSVDPRLDQIDRLVIQHAVKHKKPLMGICRGIQSIAAFMEGTLHQDIETSKLTHNHQNNLHMVKKIANRKLSSLLPNEFLINTYHHQAIKKAPKDFTVVLQHEDIIEGIEHDFLPIFGVQWHPERMNTLESKIIFDYFYDLITQNK